jgi:CMP-N-acetylneuraminic acid synthetase
MRKDAIAVIPARGGSKRLKRKNIVPLGGRPIIAYTLEAAFRSDCFDEVIVSTEDAEIAEIATREGATAMDRAAELAADNATMVDVCCDVLRRIASRGAPPARFACLLATAALRTADDIRRVRDLLRPGTCDFAMAVTEYEKSPLQALVEREDGALRLMWPALADVPRTEAPKLLVDNGSTYWCRTESFLGERTFYGHNLRGCMMPRERSVDVDTAADLSLLTYFFERTAARHA